MSERAAFARSLARVGMAIEEGPGGVPLVRPPDEAGVAHVLARATIEGRRVLPIGMGAHLDATRPGELAGGCDLLLSTSALRAIVAYEPGDGTLTAQAGCTLADLTATVRAGGHRLTPDVARPERATIGGVVASGSSGFDRERYGPVRHHVLGLRVALADGTITKSGGRLVKNVTGFDLHRLHCGARGTLGVILEASLRLFPEPEEERALVARCPDLESALEAASRVRSVRFAPLATVVEERSEAEGATLHLFLAGRRRQIVHDAARARAMLGDAEELDDARARAHRRRVFDLAGCRGEAHERPALRVATQPSLVQPVLRVLRAALAAAHVEASLVIQPAVATFELFVPQASTREGELVPLARALSRELAPLHAELSAHAAPPSVHAELAPARSDGLAWDWMERVRATLDPGATLSCSTFPGRA